ncbi:MAG: hypothetical protein LBU38_03615 [Propionibacteriaceae bacterium]|jgi:thymidine kinase|nr:hypothetical protein [Propionibacteriaceae bacterium]
MAKLYFRYGPMGSGKSAHLLIVAQNYADVGKRAYIVKPDTDTRTAAVSSRIPGVEAMADYVAQLSDNLYDVIAAELAGENDPIACILVDEAQWISRQQVNDLFLVATKLNIPVIGYGLRTDYQAEEWEGAVRWLALAQLEELKMICRCNRKATLTGRKNAEGEFIPSDFDENNQVVMGGSESYEALCPIHYLEWVGEARFRRPQK